MKVKVIQLCPTLCNPMDHTVHGILQARILELVANIFISQDQNASIVINLSRVESKQSTMMSFIINQY